MKNFSYLKYLNKVKFLLLGIFLFMGISGANGQVKKGLPADKKTFRIKILKEADGKTQVLDTTLTADGLENLKLMPGKYQNLLNDVDVLRINPEGLAAPATRIYRPAKPLTEHKMDKLRLIEERNFNADSNRNIIFFNRKLLPASGSLDSIKTRLIHIREIENFHLSPTDTNRIKEIRIIKELDEQPIRFYRVLPSSGLKEDTIRFSENFIRNGKPVKSIAIRKIIIMDLEKQDNQILSKVNNSQETDLIEDLRIKNLRYYPNPSNGRFTLDFKVPQAGDMAIKIYDQLGREIYQEGYQYFSGDYQKEINLSKADPGVYILKIIQGDSAFTKKLVIE